jgi:hypothetical protein
MTKQDYWHLRAIGYYLMEQVHTKELCEEFERLDNRVRACESLADDLRVSSETLMTACGLWDGAP